MTARAEDGEIMAVEHKEYPVYGVQFHPESVMTSDGRKMIENFSRACLKRLSARCRHNLWEILSG